MIRRHPKRRGQNGFTLIELLIVVAIIGILGGILTPYLIDALQKANQKATVGNIRAIGIAWMSWVTDQVSAGSAGAATQRVDWKNDLANPVSHAELAALLEGTGDQAYLSKLPSEDGWGHPLEFRAHFDPADRASFRKLLTSNHRYAIRSLGRDGVEDSGGDYVIGRFPTTNYNGDIVYSDGYWVRQPGAVSLAEGDGGTGTIE